MIQKTPPILFDAWVAGKGVPDAFIGELRRVLVNLSIGNDDSSPQSMVGEHSPFTGFVVRDAEFYRVVIDTTNLIKTYILAEE